MSNVKISANASGTGTVTIAAPNTNTDRTLTLPDNTGTILTTATGGIPINGPAFSAYASAAQSLSAGVNTKIQCNTEEFDTNSCYDNSTNYRFTPTVAGYYQINGVVTNAGVAGTYFFCMIYKNGSDFKHGATYPTSASAYATSVVSALIYFNGSTDYVELYAASNAPVNTVADNIRTYFQASLVRSA